MLTGPRGDHGHIGVQPRWSRNPGRALVRAHNCRGRMAASSQKLPFKQAAEHSDRCCLAEFVSNIFVTQPAGATNTSNS